MAEVFARLHLLTEEARWREAAERLIRTATGAREALAQIPCCSRRPICWNAAPWSWSKDRSTTPEPWRSRKSRSARRTRRFACCGSTARCGRTGRRAGGRRSPPPPPRWSVEGKHAACRRGMLRVCGQSWRGGTNPSPASGRRCRRRRHMRGDRAKRDGFVGPFRAFRMTPARPCRSNSSAHARRSEAAALPRDLPLIRPFRLRSPALWERGFAPRANRIARPHRPRSARPGHDRLSRPGAEPVRDDAGCARGPACAGATLGRRAPRPSQPP